MEATGCTDASAPDTLEIRADSQRAVDSNAEDCADGFPRVQAWCSRLGMLPNVVEQWATWHQSPVQAMVWFFTAQYGIHTSFGKEESIKCYV
jgi:hypothetical protein